MQKIGALVHYICTDTHKCQAAFVVAREGNDSETLTLNVQRPGAQPGPVEQMPGIPYRSLDEAQPGSWHLEIEHAGVEHPTH